MRPDPWDDGGTPAYRQRILDAQQPGFFARWRRLSIGQQALVILFIASLAFIVPAVVIVLGTIGMQLGFW